MADDRDTNTDLAQLRALNKRFIHNFVAHDVPSRPRSCIRCFGPSLPRADAWSETRTSGAWLCVLAQLTSVTADNFPADDTIVMQ